MCRAFSFVSYSLGIIAIIATAATLPTSYNGALKYRLDMKHKTSRGKSEVWLIGIVIQYRSLLPFFTKPTFAHLNLNNLATGKEKFTERSEARNISAAETSINDSRSDTFSIPTAKSAPLLITRAPMRRGSVFRLIHFGSRPSYWNRHPALLLPTRFRLLPMCQPRLSCTRRVANK